MFRFRSIHSNLVLGLLISSATLFTVVGCSSAPVSEEEALVRNKRLEDRLSRFGDLPRRGPSQVK